ncbi:hepcidin-like [Phyllopteryx taeniolatus]|uniref:hepcidin-like n=1 Tax=Phyllopteryx taeniolatus TaxID=161469 RepID=UPI0027A259D7|nr:hepcidin-like [Phyllopteryx taeniolatus]UQM94868.1 antimicrobial peptide hepcidin type II [Phyllopteryx taeniolatus]
MKTFKIAVAVILLLTYILIQESCASPFTEEEVEVRDDEVLEHFEMQSEQSKMGDHVRDKRSRNEKDCRVCCNCCHRGKTWCGLCCEWVTGGGCHFSGFLPGPVGPTRFLQDGSEFHHESQDWTGVGAKVIGSGNYENKVTKNGRQWKPRWQELTGV